MMIENSAMAIIKVRELLDDVERPLNSLMLWAGYEGVMQVLMEYERKELPDLK